MVDQREQLRVALLAGVLSQAGAEKQLVYMARALRQAGVDVRVYSLTQGDFYEAALKAMGLHPTWIGRFNNPLFRLAALARALQQFKPHVLQATHFFANLYVTIVARLCMAMAVGSIRNDTHYELDANGYWGPWLLHLPPSLLVNSNVAKRNAEFLGVKAEKIHILSNVIDLSDFDAQASREKISRASIDQPVAVTVSRLVSAKRLDRFLTALAIARREIGALKGIIVGEGPERPNLESTSRNLGLLPDGLLFLGRRDDVPALLGQVDMLVLSSDREGFPNILLEAMAARIPVVATPAGDIQEVVREGVTGYVVPFDDVEGIAKRMVRLAKSPDLRHQLGEAGRQQAERIYSYEGLADRLLSTYRSIAEQQGNRRVLRALSSGSHIQKVAQATSFEYSSK